MTDNEELKPCPFKHDDRTEKQRFEIKEHGYGDNRKRRFFVRCCICNARGSYQNSEEEAIAAWNNRIKEGEL